MNEVQEGERGKTGACEERQCPGHVTAQAVGWPRRVVLAQGRVEGRVAVRPSGGPVARKGDEARGKRVTGRVKAEGLWELGATRYFSPGTVP
jgi:hypothetical protein